MSEQKTISYMAYIYPEEARQKRGIDWERVVSGLLTAGLVVQFVAILFTGISVALLMTKIVW